MSSSIPFNGDGIGVVRVNSDDKDDDHGVGVGGVGGGVGVNDDRYYDEYGGRNNLDDEIARRTSASREPRPVNRISSRQEDDGILPQSSPRHDNSHHDSADYRTNSYDDNNYDKNNYDDYNNYDNNGSNYDDQENHDDENYYASGAGDDEAAMDNWYNSGDGYGDNNDNEMLEIKLNEEERKLFYTRLLICMYCSLAIFTASAITIAMIGNSSVDHCANINHPLEACACATKQLADGNTKNNADSLPTFVGITDRARNRRFNIIQFLINATLLDASFDEEPTSCSNINQALNFVSEPLMYPLGAQLNNERQIIQRYVLILLYLETKGLTSWGQKDNWAQPITECNWHGIECFEKTIFALDLAANGLHGELPTAAIENGLLPSLRIIHFQNNTNLQGTLFDSPATTTATTAETLSSSSSSSSSQGNWLRVLYVGNTNMTGDIDGLTSLSNLERLDLHESSFSSTIPTALGELTRLTHLNLFSNDFTGTIPNELALLQNLQFADFGFNPGLTGTVPAALCTVAPLETVVVDCDNDALNVGECTCCQCAETTTNRQ